ncbi:MAG: metallophosphoesterase [Clostridiales bacterium]|nr:metallophosphoesterase [Clostridiales bacterium]
MKLKKSVLSLLLAFIIALSLLSPAFAKEVIFNPDAYATIITASDFQDVGVKAYDRFEKIISNMKKEGLDDPDSVLIGGDYSLVLPDYATQGVHLIKEKYTSVYPNENENSIVFIQGNHDWLSNAFTKTGFHDMGSYCIYVLNEDDFTWKQTKNTSPDKIKSIADDLSKNLDNMISSDDNRPVFVLTHVPLHYTVRADGKDNLYASYIFDVLNEKANQLDIVFLFGHNHSSEVDNYIGGSVNFFKPGDKINIPDPENKSTVTFSEKTLNFTYLNYGYVGYSNNANSDGSVNTLTVGTIELSEETISFIKFSE